MAAREQAGQRQLDLGAFADDDLRGMVYRAVERGLEWVEVIGHRLIVSIDIGMSMTLASRDRGFLKLS
jgi:hypothetical protein